MRLKIKPLCLLLLLVPLFSACNNKKETKEDSYETIIYNDGTEEIVKKPTIATYTENGSEVSILPTSWMDYYKDLDDFENAYNYYAPNVEDTMPRSFRAMWTNENPTNEYQIVVATNKEMNDPVVYDTTATFFELKDLFAGTHYYYQIKAKYEDRTVISRRFDFKTADFFRTISISNVLNARDLGNKVTNDGKKRVKQGLIYRTANFDSVNYRGKIQAIEQYGIKTDLDLREPGPTESPLGPDVKYVNNGVSTQGSPIYVSYDSGVNVAEYQEAMRDNLKTLADPENYPLAFHCAVGRDRTGTLAITLYLLLGVNLEQIKQDYVVSVFSKACNSTNDFPNYATQMKSLIRYYEKFKTGAQSEDIDIYQRVENYCLHIGVSKDEINSIRNILLQDA